MQWTDVTLVSMIPIEDLNDVTLAIQDTDKDDEGDEDDENDEDDAASTWI